MFHEAASPSRRWSSNSPPLQLRSKLSSVHQLTSSQAHARSIPASQVDERSVYPHDGARAHRAARGVAPRPSWRLLAHPSRLRRRRLDSNPVALLRHPLKAPFPTRARCRTCRLARSSRSIASWVVPPRATRATSIRASHAYLPWALPWSRRSMRASTVSSDGKGLKRRARIWTRCSARAPLCSSAPRRSPRRRATTRTCCASRGGQCALWNMCWLSLRRRYRSAARSSAWLWLRPGDHRGRSEAFEKMGVARSLRRWAGVSHTHHTLASFIYIA